MTASPQQTLQLQGPRVQVAVGAAQSLISQLIQRGDTPPSPFTGVALIDTGATVTSIDNSVAQQLKLPVIDVQDMSSASHAKTPCNIYPVSITIAGLQTNLDVPRCMGAELQPFGIVVLIGRDILSRCTFHYNGLTAEFTLAI
jgi:predicted aspartyl protease